MGRVGELIVEYAGLLQPNCGADFATFAEQLRNTTNRFRTSIRELGNVEEEIVQGLCGLLVSREWREVNLWLNAADECASPNLVRPLCDLLDIRDEYVQHEWIAEILGKLRSPRAIGPLSNACSFDVPGDVFRSLPKICLTALKEIGTPAAIAEVRSHASSPWPEVREFAAELLDEST